MKNLNQTIIIGIFFVLLACTPTKEEAIKYNDDLIVIEKALSAKENIFINTIINNKGANEITVAYNELVNQASEALISLEKIKKFDSGESYLKAAKEYFVSINEITNNEYKQLLNIVVKEKKEITEQDEALFKNLTEKTQNKSDIFYSKFQSEQQLFALKHRFKILVDTAQNYNQ